MTFQEVKLQPFNLNGDPVLTITMQAQARDEVAVIWRWGGGEQTQCPPHGAVATRAGE